MINANNIKAVNNLIGELRSTKTTYNNKGNLSFKSKKKIADLEFMIAGLYLLRESYKIKNNRVKL